MSDGAPNKADEARGGAVPHVVMLRRIASRC